MRLLASGLVVVVALGCTQGAGSPVDVAEEVVLACGDAIDRTSALPEAYAEIAGVAALPAADRSAPLQVSASPDPVLPFFAKTGLLVRPSAAFLIVVPEEYRDRAAIGWGNAGTETHRLVVPGCPSELDDWLVFAGGFAVTAEACIELEVLAGSESERVSIGVGAPCPGQETG